MTYPNTMNLHSTRICPIHAKVVMFWDGGSMSFHTVLNIDIMLLIVCCVWGWELGRLFLRMLFGLTTFCFFRSCFCLSFVLLLKVCRLFSNYVYLGWCFENLLSLVLPPSQNKLI